MRPAILALLCSILFAHAARAQDAGDRVAAIDSAYRQLDYDRADSLAALAVERAEAFSLRQLADVHTYRALIAYGRGALDEARGQFLAALELVPDLKLDPVLVPPKIQEFVDELRAEALTAAPSTRYVTVRDPRTEAALRSAILPGWGQHYKGHTKRGYLMTGLFVGGAAGTVATHLRRIEARRSYEEALGSRQEDDRYEVYRDWSRARAAFLVGTAAVWAAAYVDALLSTPARGGSVSWTATPAAVSLRLQL